MIVARYIYSEKHVLEATRQIAKATAPWLSYLPIAGAVMISVLIYQWVMHDHAPWDNVSPLIFGLVFCMTPLIARRQVMKNFRSNPEAGLEQVWHVDETTLTYKSTGATSTFEWSKLVRVRETKLGFLLFPQEKLAFWLPKSAFSLPEDISSFREYMLRSAVAKKN